MPQTHRYKVIVFFSDYGNYTYKTNNYKSLLNYLITLNREPLFMHIYYYNSFFIKSQNIASQQRINEIRKNYKITLKK